jgi:hypothetical protein
LMPSRLPTSGSWKQQTSSLLYQMASCLPPEAQPPGVFEAEVLRTCYRLIPGSEEPVQLSSLADLARLVSPCAYPSLRAAPERRIQDQISIDRMQTWMLNPQIPAFPVHFLYLQDASALQFLECIYPEIRRFLAASTARSVR